MHAIAMSRTCQSGSPAATRPGAAEGDLRGAKYAGARRPRAVVIAFAAGVILALTATAHAQPLSRSRQPDEPIASRLWIKDRQISMAVNHDGQRQHRRLDSDLQQLYDQIMSRVGASYPR